MHDGGGRARCAGWPGGELVEAAAQGAEKVTKGVDAFDGRKEGMGVMEVDARDALGGRWGAGGGRVAGRGGVPD